MFTILMILAVFVAIVLMVIVLLQSSKGGGLAGTFGGGGGQMGAMFGARRTADFLSRASWWLGGILVALSIVINLFFLPGSSTAEDRDSIIQQGGQNNVPTQPTAPPQTPNLPQQ